MGGNPLASAEEVISQLTAAGVELTELEATTLDGVNTRVFDITNADVGATLLRFSPLDVAEDYLGWDAPAAGRMWLIEHPDIDPDRWASTPQHWGSQLWRGPFSSGDPGSTSNAQVESLVAATDVEDGSQYL